MQTDISLSQFLAIQEKGVSAWEFEPELEIANCFVEGRTEIEFFDSACSVQSNLPIPKQNEVYYWESKIYDKPESTLISIGVTTKPYPLFRLPGMYGPICFVELELIQGKGGTSVLSHTRLAVTGDSINPSTVSPTAQSMCKPMSLVLATDLGLARFSSRAMEKN